MRRDAVGREGGAEARDDAARSVLSIERDDLGAVERLEHELLRALFHRLDGHRHRPVRADDDHRKVRRALAERREQGDAVHARHAHVRHDEVDGRASHLLEGAFTGRCRARDVPRLLQQANEHDAQRVVVIDHENLARPYHPMSL